MICKIARTNRRQGKGEGIKWCRVHLMWWSVGKQTTIDNRNYFADTSKGGDNGWNMTPGHMVGEENVSRWEGRRGGQNTRPLPHSGITRLKVRQSRPA